MTALIKVFMRTSSSFLTRNKINVRKLFVAFSIFLPIHRFFKGPVLESNDTGTGTTRSRYSNHGEARLSPAKGLSLLPVHVLSIEITGNHAKIF